METFHWRLQKNSAVAAQPRVRKIKFGDGYPQRQQEGINNDLRMYSVTFTGLTDEINLIDDFLTKHNGVKAFLWVEPNRYRLITVVCEKWNITPNGDAKTITATFEEVVA